MKPIPMRNLLVLAALLALSPVTMARGQGKAQTTHITVDAGVGRHTISPLIYGVCFGDENQLRDLGATINRQGGNNFSRYNWKVNTDNIDSDWYFESIAGW